MGVNNCKKMEVLNIVEGTDDLIVERYFNESGALSFEELLRSYVQQYVEPTVQQSYHDDQVNVATSDEGVA